MSLGSLAVVEAWLDAVNRGDDRRVEDLSAEDVEIVGPRGRVPEALRDRVVTRHLDARLLDDVALQDRAHHQPGGPVRQQWSDRHVQLVERQAVAVRTAIGHRHAPGHVPLHVRVIATVAGVFPPGLVAVPAVREARAGPLEGACHPQCPGSGDPHPRPRDLLPQPVDQWCELRTDRMEPGERVLGRVVARQERSRGCGGRAPAGETLRFATRSGTLTASPAPEGAVALDFPAEPVQPVEAPPGLLDGLGVRALFVGRNRLDTLVEVDDEATVRGLTPDLAVLATLPGRGFMVTAAAGPGTAADFVSRFFAPGTGIDEDPVTGSAHCALGPYWSERIGRRKLVGQQLSPRGGAVGVEVWGDRVTLTGRAVTVVEGAFVARAEG